MPAPRIALRPSPPLLAGLLAALLLASAQVGAQSRPAPVFGVRTGDHAGFGRVVLDLGPGMRPAVSSREGVVTVKVDSPAGSVVPADGARAPRNVAAMVVDDGQLELTLVPGAKLRSYRLGTRLVLDIADPEPAKPAASAVASPAPATADSQHQPGVSVAAPAAPVLPVPPAYVPPPSISPPSISPARPATGAMRSLSGDTRRRAEEDHTAAPAPAASPAAVPSASPGALAPMEVVHLPLLGLSATLASSAGIGPAAPPRAVSVTLPFGSTSGAAALRRGDAAMVVFDERRPIDLSALGADPVFGTASITMLPDATVLHLPLPGEAQIRLSRADSGWTVTVLPSETSSSVLLPIRAEAQEGRLRLSATAPGRVVAVPDPLSGSTLLVGTQRSAGQGMPVDRRSPEFALLPTWQGVALLPLSDAVALRPQPDGFVLAAEAGRVLSLSAGDSQIQAITDAAAASRRFDLPAQPVEALRRRLQAARLAAAGAAPQARTSQRRAMAEAMLALAMGPEMQAVLGATVAEDARAAEDPDIAALSAIAALLAGRIDQSAAIDDPSLDGTDEIAFWRAVRAAMLQPAAPRAAAIFSSAMPLLLSYPAPLRERLLPLALETMAQGGEAGAAKAMLARIGEQPALDLARAMVAERGVAERGVAERGGDTVAALALYDRVAAGTDRRARAQAARRAVELRLASGELTPAKAADALERLVYAWRGDGVEIAIRLRIVELRAQSGAWRTALVLLREMRRLFPEQEEAAARALVDIFARSLAPEAQDKLSALDLVALAEENADLLPTGPAGHALAMRLADRLMALDLPGRALPVLEKLIDQAPAGIGRATLGASLAGLRLEQNAPEAALDALASSVVEGALPPELLERRTLIFARAAAETGGLATAIAALGELGTPSALALRATLLERAKDWPAATAALGALVRTNLPAEGPLDSAQSGLVLRLAAAAVLAGDARTLATLRATLAPRLAADQMRDLATLLAAAPVQGVADLPRAAQEARLARTAAASLRALAPGAAP